MTEARSDLAWLQSASSLIEALRRIDAPPDNARGAFSADDDGPVTPLDAPPG